MRRALGSLAVAMVIFSATPARADAPAHLVLAYNNYFEPRVVEATVGDTVVWSLARSGGHTITADNGTFDFAPSRYVPVYVRLSEPGVVDYYCRIHGLPGGRGMSGVIEVEAAG